MIQRLLGHSTPDLSLRVYTHVMDEDLVNARLELDDVIEEKAVRPVETEGQAADD